MNFFGHSVLAAWISDDPRVALGSMLPDFASIIRGRAIESKHPAVKRGIELHHQCDRVFHNSDTFLELQAAGRTQLERAGVRNGPRLAVAHVGLELILDAELRHGPGRLERYQRALLVGREFAPSLSFTSASRKGLDPLTLRVAYDELLETLTSRILYLTPHSPQDLVERLTRILSPRQRLRPIQSEQVAMLAWAEMTWPEVARRTEAWMNDLAKQLDVDPVPVERAPSIPEPNTSITK